MISQVDEKKGTWSTLIEIKDIEDDTNELRLQSEFYGKADNPVATNSKLLDREGFWVS